MIKKNNEISKERHCDLLLPEHILIYMYLIGFFILQIGLTDTIIFIFYSWWKAYTCRHGSLCGPLIFNVIFIANFKLFLHNKIFKYLLYLVNNYVCFGMRSYMSDIEMYHKLKGYVITMMSILFRKMTCLHCYLYQDIRKNVIHQSKYLAILTNTVTLILIFFTLKKSQIVLATLCIKRLSALCNHIWTAQRNFLYVHPALSDPLSYVTIDRIFSPKMLCRLFQATFNKLKWRPKLTNMAVFCFNN